jgi:hypothetical protein
MECSFLKNFSIRLGKDAGGKTTDEEKRESINAPSAVVASLAEQR